MPRLSERDRSSLGDDLPLHDSPGSENPSKHVVVVMDGMTQFTMETLQWTLDNVVTAGCRVTLLGVMPWLNIPLLLKTRNDFWMVELEDVDLVKKKSASGYDVKYLERKAVINLCRKYGVELTKKTVMGYPRRLRVVEQIKTLHPTWVVFDRHHKRNKEFYAQKIPCNILMMNDDGKVDVVKSRVKIQNNGGNSFKELPISSAPTPQFSEESKEAIKKKDEMPMTKAAEIVMASTH